MKKRIYTTKAKLKRKPSGPVSLMDRRDWFKVDAINFLERLVVATEAQAKASARLLELSEQMHGERQADRQTALRAMQSMQARQAPPTPESMQGATVHRDGDA